MVNIIVQSMKPVVFRGNSRKVLRSFPKTVRADIGIALRNLQRSKAALDVKPVKEVGTGVFELRTEDSRTWYRVLYLVTSGRVFVLHAFEKRSNRIPKNEIGVASERLFALYAKLAAEKKSEKNE